jgi:hypothetical protein
MLNGECLTPSLREYPEAVGARGGCLSARAKYVVATDGASNFVIQALSIGNVDKGYFFDWLILDPTPNEPYTTKPAKCQLWDSQASEHNRSSRPRSAVSRPVAKLGGRGHKRGLARYARPRLAAELHTGTQGLQSCA